MHLDWRLRVWRWSVELRGSSDGGGDFSGYCIGVWLLCYLRMSISKPRYCPFLNRDTVKSDEIISILLAYVWLNHHIMQ